MKNKKALITIISAVAVIVVIVLVTMNPFDGGINSHNSTPNGNSVHIENPSDNPDSSSEEGEITNPSGEEITPTFRISPGKFYIDDEDHVEEVRNSAGVLVQRTVHGTGVYTAGKPQDFYLKVTNKNDFAAKFSVDYRVPDNVAGGYSRPTEQARNWIWISDKRPSIPAGETLTVTIRLSMPEPATPPGDKWEFWIGVIDQSQTGWLIVEQASRFLVTMG